MPGKSFDEILEAELEKIRESRSRRLDKDVPEFKGKTARDKAHDAQLIGLAFSGGGIRSATFNLGVLQALARKKLLRRMDYLSTVSGGGYIGGWLHAWSKRAGGIRAVEEQLADGEPPQVSFLRRFSNYLTPKLGLFSADTWTAVATYLRNLTLTFAALLPAIVGLVLVPLLITSLSQIFLGAGTVVVGIGAAVAVLAFLFAFFNLGRERHATQAGVQLWIVLPCLVGAWLGGLVLWWIARRDPPIWVWGIGALGAYLGAALAGWLGGRGKPPDRLFTASFTLLAALFAGVAAALPLWLLARFFAEIGTEPAVALGAPLLTQVFALSVVVHIGLLDRSLGLARLEWWGRFGAWLFIANIAWAALFAVVLYGPSLFTEFERVTSAFVAHVTWLAPVIAGVVGGRSARSRGAVMKLVIALAPYILVVCLLALVSRGLQVGAEKVGPWLILPVALTVAGLFLLIRRFDINRFSMHLFYRNRLVRCYLGASRKERQADPFTGFSPDDDESLAELDTAASPYPILNTALNLVSTDDLAWQERKAASFAMTPLHSGYEFAGGQKKGAYRPTAEYAGGLSLGTAVAISGAAASPNMGYHSSASVTLLLTLFNVRLGWWQGNTTAEKAWKEDSPECGLCYLLRETLGMTGADAEYVYLSDGGHFENLATYELVRRRCRFIIVTDAGQDASGSFDDLGNLLRKCRNDFGIDIEIGVDTLVRGDDGKSRWHCAVGTIRYDKVDEGASPGTLLYIKPTLTGDEPGDVLNYANRNPSFPHQSTGDQWFDESQFESYRRLGQHIADKVLEPALTGGNDENETLFLRLKEAWYRPLPTAERFARHGEALDKLLDHVREDGNLAFLEPQIWPEFPRLVKEADDGVAAGMWLPKSVAALEAGFLYCLSLIKFMENAYIDLDLEDEYDHPDNRGWMNLFRHWSWSSMARVTWAIAGPTYGARFQTWCERRLSFELGNVVVESRKPTARGSFKTVVKKARAALELNPHECDLIDKLGDIEKPELLVLKQVVTNPLGDGEIDFAFGFALVSQGKLIFFRVQDHLRKVGLARRALRTILENKMVTAFDGERAAELVPARSVDAFRHLYRSVELEVG